MAALLAFLRWWGAELFGLLPVGLRRRLGARPVVIADPDGGGFRFTRLRGGRAEAVTAPLAGLPLWLRLPPEAVLTRRLDWPALPPADLRRAVLLDLDRQTPLPAAALLADLTVVARDPAARRVTLELAVARRDAVAPLLARLGTPPARIGAAAPDDPAGLRFDLRPAEPGATTARPGFALPRSARGRLALACAVLVALNLGLWWSRERDRRAALADAVAEARRRVASVEMLRTAVAERRRLREEILSRGGGPTLLGVLDELTRLVPDGAWLDSVEVRGGSVYVTGYAPAAVTLVALIEASPMFADAQFRSPVVPEGTGLERFDMTIGLRGGLRGASVSGTRGRP